MTLSTAPIREVLHVDDREPPPIRRKGLRYPSDLTDAEWDLVKPLIPRAKRGGRKREIVVRDVLNGILYVLSTACQWRALPKDLPPRNTVHGYL